MHYRAYFSEKRPVLGYYKLAPHSDNMTVVIKNEQLSEQDFVIRMLNNRWYYIVTHCSMNVRLSVHRPECLAFLRFRL